MAETTWVFFKGQQVPMEEARVGVATHALHYGTACFEGIRGNWNETDGKVYIFRMREHYERLLRGCNILRINLPYSADDLCQITVDLLERNGFAEDVYIRPLAYKSQEAVANLRLHQLEDDFTLMIQPFGAYIEADGAIRCQTSSWRRPDDTMLPTGVKITGLYTTSILAKTEAIMAGYNEAILLNYDGSVSEGSGENLFMVSNGKIFTPYETANALLGITRDSVMTLAKNELGIEVEPRRINRSELYLADEIFLTGTAAHITPVGQIDNRDIADGNTGEITNHLQGIYFDCITGLNPDYKDWCVGVTPGGG